MSYVIDSIQDALPAQFDGVSFTVTGVTKSQRGDLPWVAAHVAAVRADGTKFDVCIGDGDNGTHWSAFGNREALGLKVGEVNPVLARGAFDGFASVATIINGI